MDSIIVAVKIVGIIAVFVWTSHAAYYKPLTLAIFVASFAACLLKFGLALFGPSLVLLLPVLWIVSMNAAKFVNDKIDAFFEGAERLVKAAADWIVATATNAGCYVVSRPLAALLCAAFWYALPCKKCAWYMLILGPVSYRVCVKVALRVGRLREPAKEFVGNAGSAAVDKSRAALSGSGRVVRAALGRVPEAAPSSACAAAFAAAAANVATKVKAAANVATKVKAAANAIRNRVSQVSLQDVHSAYASFAYAFNLAYLQLVVYVAWNYYAWLSDTYDGFEPSLKMELMEDHMWPRLAFLLEDPANVKIVIGFTFFNVGAYTFFQSAEFEDLYNHVEDVFFSTLERAAASIMAGSVKIFLVSLALNVARRGAAAAGQASVLSQRAKIAAIHAKFLVQNGVKRACSSASNKSTELHTGTALAVLRAMSMVQDAVKEMGSACVLEAATAARATKALCERAKHLFLRAWMMARRVPAHELAVLILVSFCAWYPDYFRALPQQASLAATSTASKTVTLAASFDLLLKDIGTAVSTNAASSMESVVSAISLLASSASASTSSMVDMVATSARAIVAAVSTNAAFSWESVVITISLAWSASASTFSKVAALMASAKVNVGQFVDTNTATKVDVSTAKAKLHACAAKLYALAVSFDFDAVLVLVLSGAGMLLIVRHLRVKVPKHQKGHLCQRSSSQSKTSKGKAGGNRRRTRPKNSESVPFYRSFVFAFVVLSIMTGITCWSFSYYATKLDGVSSVRPPVRRNAESVDVPALDAIHPAAIDELFRTPKWMEIMPSADPNDVQSTISTSSEPIDGSQVTHKSAVESLEVFVHQAVKVMSQEVSFNQTARRLIECFPPSVRATLQRSFNVIALESDLPQAEPLGQGRVLLSARSRSKSEVQRRASNTFRLRNSVR